MGRKECGETVISNVCMYVCMYVCMDGWMDGWMDVVCSLKSTLILSRELFLSFRLRSENSQCHAASWHFPESTTHFSHWLC